MYRILIIFFVSCSLVGCLDSQETQETQKTAYITKPTLVKNTQVKNTIKTNSPTKIPTRVTTQLPTIDKTLAYANSMLETQYAKTMANPNSSFCPPNVTKFCPCYTVAKYYLESEPNMCFTGIVQHVNQTSKAFFINFDFETDSLYAVSFDYSWPKELEGNCIRVEGKLTLYEGRPEIIITSPEQIQTCDE